MTMVETKEALVAINEVALLLCERLKDGFQMTDDISAIFAKFATDFEFMAKVKAGYENISAIPAEVKTINILEAVDLITLQVAYIPKFVAVFEKK